MLSVFGFRTKPQGEYFSKASAIMDCIPFPSHHPFIPQRFLNCCISWKKKVISSLWHHRLGHPSNKVVSLMLKKSNITSVVDSTPKLCSNCIKGKISKLPFTSATCKLVNHFDIVHSDVWGPAPCLSMYLICWIFPL